MQSFAIYNVTKKTSDKKETTSLEKNTYYYNQTLIRQKIEPSKMQYFWSTSPPSKITKRFPTDNNEIAISYTRCFAFTSSSFISDK